MEIIIDELTWAQWNIDHMFEKHSVTPAEVIESMNEPYTMVIPAKQDRVMIMGRAGSRLLSTILQAQEQENMYFVVTSRDMSKKERALYRSQKGAK